MCSLLPEIVAEVCNCLKHAKAPLTFKDLFSHCPSVVDGLILSKILHKGLEDRWVRVLPNHAYVYLDGDTPECGSLKPSSSEGLVAYSLFVSLQEHTAQQLADVTKYSIRTVQNAAKRLLKEGYAVRRGSNTHYFRWSGAYMHPFALENHAEYPNPRINLKGETS